MVSDRRLRRYELVGIGFVILVGSLLHFVFDWAGGSPLIAPFGTVNESLWEHLKMVFWPIVLWGFLVERPALGLSYGDLAVAKLAGVLAAMLVIIGLHYGYRAFTGDHILWLDILVFILAAIAGQLVSLWVLRRAPVTAGAGAVAALGLIALAVAFTVFSFDPPRLPIFLDESTGQYGH